MCPSQAVSHSPPLAAEYRKACLVPPTPSFPSTIFPFSSMLPAHKCHTTFSICTAGLATATLPGGDRSCITLLADRKKDDREQQGGPKYKAQCYTSVGVECNSAEEGQTAILHRQGHCAAKTEFKMMYGCKVHAHNLNFRQVVKICVSPLINCISSVNNGEGNHQI